MGSLVYAKRVLDADLRGAEEEERLEFITRRRHLSPV